MDTQQQHQQLRASWRRGKNLIVLLIIEIVVFVYFSPFVIATDQEKSAKELCACRACISKREEVDGPSENKKEEKLWS